MNKSTKIIIGVVLFTIIILSVILGIWFNKEIRTKIGTIDNGQKFEIIENIKIVMVNGKLYYETGKTSDALRCGMMDGKITSNVDGTQIPTIDNQSNFEGEYSYQYGQDNTIEIYINNQWWIFETKEGNVEKQYYFYGKIIEVNKNSIIVEPNQEEEIRQSADKISIDLGKNNDSIYKVGTNVKITYTGYVMETYPAKVEATKIEIKSEKNFLMYFYDKQS